MPFTGQSAQPFSASDANLAVDDVFGLAIDDTASLNIVNGGDFDGQSASVVL